MHERYAHHRLRKKHFFIVYACWPNTILILTSCKWTKTKLLREVLFLDSAQKSKQKHSLILKTIKKEMKYKKVFFSFLAYLRYSMESWALFFFIETDYSKTKCANSALCVAERNINF